MRSIVSLVAGALFAIGLAYAGMTQPERVMGFLDVFSRWDPTLVCVIGGATGTYFLLLNLTKSKQQPFFATKFLTPTRRDLDAPLLVGAALFGIGWGLMGLCPGPAVASIVAGDESTLLFVGAMLLGMLGHSGFARMRLGTAR